MEEARLNQSTEALKKDVYFQIACEAKEGQFLNSDESPFKNLIIIPLEIPEHYDFFTLRVPDFKKIIVSVLTFYPWRIK